MGGITMFNSWKKLTLKIFDDGEKNSRELFSSSKGNVTNEFPKFRLQNIKFSRLNLGGATYPASFWQSACP